MPYNVHTLPDARYEHYADLLKSAGAATLAHQQADSGELTIVLTSEERIRQLNAEFGQSDEPTDVLSFTSMDLDPDNGLLYFGDVIISFPSAEKQALAAGHALEDELCLLAVHGILHLLGHSHARNEERLLMWSAQREILARLGRKAHVPEAE